jgi:hypothetical protein
VLAAAAAAAAGDVAWEDAAAGYKWFSCVRWQKMAEEGGGGEMKRMR